MLGITLSLGHLKKIEKPDPGTREYENSVATETSAHAICLAETNEELNQHQLLLHETSSKNKTCTLFFIV